MKSDAREWKKIAFFKHKKKEVFWMDGKKEEKSDKQLTRGLFRYGADDDEKKEKKSIPMYTNTVMRFV